MKRPYGRCKRKLTDAQILEIRERRIAGEGYESICLDYDVESTTVRSYCLDIPNPPFPRPGRPRKFDYDKARKLAELGWSKNSIAKHLGVSRISIYRVLKNGVNNGGPVQNRRKPSSGGRKGARKERPFVWKFVEAERRCRRVYDAGPEMGQN